MKYIKIILLDVVKVISGNMQQCKTFSNFYQEVVKSLGASDSFNISYYSHSNPLKTSIGKYENYPSVKKIRKTITITPNFHFSDVNKAHVKNSSGNLNFSKIGTL